MDVRVGLWRKLSAKELMLLNCGAGEDSWESLGQQGDPTSPFWRRSALGFLWREWCWSWNSNTLATSCEELTHWKRLWCWEASDLGQEEKGTTEDEMAGWHHWLDGCESEWTPGVCDGQGGLACCDSWGCKESDMTEWLNWAELNLKQYFLVVHSDTYPILNFVDLCLFDGHIKHRWWTWKVKFHMDSIPHDRFLAQGKLSNRILL